MKDILNTIDPFDPSTLKLICLTQIKPPTESFAVALQLDREVKSRVMNEAGECLCVVDVTSSCRTRVMLHVASGIKQNH